MSKVDLAHYLKHRIDGSEFVEKPETVLDCLHVALLVSELARKQLRLERRRQMRPEERAALHETLRALEEVAVLQPIDPGARARLTKSVAVWQTLLADGDPEHAAQRPRGLN